MTPIKQDFWTRFATVRELYGTNSGLAMALGVTSASVGWWINNNNVGAEAILALILISDGMITLEDFVGEDVAARAELARKFAEKKRATIPARKPKGRIRQEQPNSRKEETHDER